jgi:DNA-directed RNA polymerase specialized sigma24 family protein
MSQHDPIRPDDYARLPDETLVVRARDHDDRQAENALLTRHLAWIGRVVFRVARHRLPPSAWEDALQVGLYAIREAIADYRPGEPGQASGLCFRAFLALVVKRRVLNLAMQLHRQDQHLVPERPGSTAAAGGPVAVADDPALLAQRHEAVERLLRKLGQFAPSDRRLVETLVSDETLGLVAAEWGLAYGVVKRRRQQLLALLQRELRDAVA